MTRLFYCISLILGILMAVPTVNAQNATDGDGYPTMYVRGDQTGDWSVNEDYRFSREGDTYTLHLDALDGHFKISNADWTAISAQTAKARPTYRLRQSRQARPTDITSMPSDCMTWIYRSDSSSTTGSPSRRR